jgi:integrase
MSKTTTERTRSSAWQGWESWCRPRGYESLGAHSPLAEYLEWLVDPYGANLGASSAMVAYWAIRSTHLRASWRDPAFDPTVARTLSEIRSDSNLSKPRRLARRFSHEEVEAITSSISTDSPRGLRDAALLWLGYEGALRANRLTALHWRHVKFAEYGAQIKILGRSAKNNRVVTLYEQEEPLAALKAWYGVRRRRGDEPVFVSIPWSNNRVSSNQLSTSDVSRIVARRTGDAGLGQANASALVRRR